MIHKAIIKSQVAVLYYQQHRNQHLTKEQARSRFEGDRFIDLSLVSKIIDQIFQEQKEMLQKARPHGRNYEKRQDRLKGIIRQK